MSYARGSPKNPSSHRPGIAESAPLAPCKGKDALAETRTRLMADVENLSGPLKAQS